MAIMMVASNPMHPNEITALPAFLRRAAVAAVAHPVPKQSGRPDRAAHDRLVDETLWRSRQSVARQA
jgi:hypothetical protein